MNIEKQYALRLQVKYDACKTSAKQFINWVKENSNNRVSSVVYPTRYKHGRISLIINNDSTMHLKLVDGIWECTIL